MKNNSKNIEACFIATTQFHFLITDIYARYLHDRYGIRSTVLYRIYKGFDISKFETDGKYRIIPFIFNSDTVAGRCIHALQCGYLFTYMAWEKLLDADKRILLFVFYDGVRLACRMIDYVKEIDERNRVILVEEGNATYLDGLDQKHKILRRAKHRLMEIVFGCGRISDVPGDNRLIDTVIVQEPERYSRLEKAKNQRIVQQNKNIIMLSNAFMDHYAAVNKSRQKYDVIYLGQPYYRNGRFNESENECLKTILSSIPTHLRVLIKPHPRDQKGKYQDIVKEFKNVSLIDEHLSAIPVEALIGMLQTKAIVSIQSSASITIANMMPEIRSIVLWKTPEVKSMFMALKKTGEIVTVLQDNKFKGRYNNIYCPANMKAFSNVLLYLTQHKTDTTAFLEQNMNIQLTEIDDLIGEA